MINPNSAGNAVNINRVSGNVLEYVVLHSVGFPANHIPKPINEPI